MQAFERAVQRQESFRRGRVGSDFATKSACDFLERGDRLTAATLQGGLPARMADEDLPHGGCGNGQEVSAILEIPAGASEELDVCLVHEGCGVQRLGAWLPSPLDAGDLAKFVVHEG